MFGINEQYFLQCFVYQTSTEWHSVFNVNIPFQSFIVVEDIDLEDNQLKNGKKKKKKCDDDFIDYFKENNIEDYGFILKISFS